MDKSAFGVVASITNPSTTGYLAYLAFADSWSQVADQVILVDGGSTDDSITFLRDWIGHRRNVIILENGQTQWGEHCLWHVSQPWINMNFGLAHLDVQWGFVQGADHVLDLATTAGMRRELADLEQVSIVAYYRGKPGSNGIRRRVDARSYAINLRLHGKESPAIIGMDLDTGLGSDWPLFPVYKSVFQDPQTRFVKRIYSGRAVSVGNSRLSVQCISYGHFFFTVEQCMQKVRRWDRANARFLGIAPKRDLELKLLNQIYAIKGFRSKEEVMAWDHPPEVLKVIDAFYEPGMLGGAIREISPIQARAAQALRKLLGLERHLRTRWMRARGYRGLKELHQWVPLDAPDPEPLDVARVYAEQDRFLPSWARLQS